MDSTELRHRIRRAQIEARERAAIAGLDSASIQAAGIHAAEQVVVQDLMRLRAATDNPGAQPANVVDLAAYRTRRGR